MCCENMNLESKWNRYFVEIPRGCSFFGLNYVSSLIWCCFRRAAQFYLVECNNPSNCKRSHAKITKNAINQHRAVGGISAEAISLMCIIIKSHLTKPSRSKPPPSSSFPHFVCQSILHTMASSFYLTIYCECHLFSVLCIFLNIPLAFSFSWLASRRHKIPFHCHYY